MSTPSTTKPSAAQSPVQPPTAAATAPRHSKTTKRPPASAARKAALAGATAAIVGLIFVVAGVPRRSRSDDRVSPVQPIEAPQRAADPVATASTVTVSPASSSAAASPATPTKSTKKAASRATAAVSTPATSTTSAAETPVREEPARKQADNEPTTTPAPASSAAETAGFAPVTITGCLEVSVNEDRFRLTDTEGGAAPKARSWRSGFLKKRSAAVDLIGTSDRLSLDKQVGKRIEATGVLTDRILRVGSVRVVSPSC